MKKEKLELRMYGLVPYNISPIQQGIQFGHAVVEYGLKHNNEAYKDWAKNWKTFIILNGGTTNTKADLETGLPVGSLNNHYLNLHKLGVKTAVFHEPDLGDQLTAVVFLLDERIFNRVKYPDFIEWAKNPDTKIARTQENWIKMIGGKNNVKIRDYISKFRLA